MHSAHKYHFKKSNLHHTYIILIHDRRYIKERNCKAYPKTFIVPIEFHFTQGLINN